MVKFRRYFLPLLLIVLVYTPYTFGQTASIQGNGDVDTLNLQTSEAFSLSLGITADGVTNEADWWLVRQTGPGNSFEHYDLASKSWVAGLVPSFQGPVATITVNDFFTASTGHPIGDYTYYFGVDLNQNGQVDTDSLRFRSLAVMVTAAPQEIVALEAACTGVFDTSPTEESLMLQVDGTRAIFRGLIDDTTPQKVNNLIKNNPEVRTIVMAYGPGSEDDESNLVASRMIRQAGLNTCVPDNGEVHSGAADFFLSGNIRRLGTNSVVGVHTWAEGSVLGSDLPRDDPRHRLYLDFYETIGISSEFYFFTLQASGPNDTHNMTVAERIMFGIENPPR